METRIPIWRRERPWILALTLVGAILRLWSFPRLGLQHFDEGIYAESGFWAVMPGGIPDSLIAYAPPGLSILIGLAYRIAFPWPGVTALAAIAPSLLCGIATIPLAGWIGRRTFGTGAGAAASAFAALSGPHVAFSRMALTDVPFLLAWLVAIGLGARFLERPGFGRGLALGLAVGLAQNFKYNGWLAGAIVGLTAIVGLVADPEHRRPAAIGRTFGWGMLAALVAALVYLPWFLFVEDHGGYASLLAHHRSYLGGLGSWWPHWKLQMAQSVALAGLVSGDLTWSGLAWPLAWLGAAAVAGRLAESEDRGSGFRFRLILLGGTAALGLLPNLPWWLAIVWLPWFGKDRRPAVRLLVAWWFVMAVLTPFYHPYARLWLPLHAAGWLVMAGWVVWLRKEPAVDPEAGRDPQRRPAWFPWRWRILLFGLSLALAIGTRFGSEESARPLPALLAPSDGLRRIAARWNDPEFTPSPPPRSVRVLARPAFRFAYLTTGSARWPLEIVPDWESARMNLSSGDWVVLDELLLRQEPEGSEGRRVLGRLLEHRDGMPDPLNGPTLLDADPAAAHGHSTIGEKPGYTRDWNEGTLPRREGTPSARLWLIKGSDLQRWIAP